MKVIISKFLNIKHEETCKASVIIQKTTRDDEKEQRRKRRHDRRHVKPEWAVKSRAFGISQELPGLKVREGVTMTNRIRRIQISRMSASSISLHNERKVHVTE